MTVAARVKARRESLGLSQGELAKRLGLNSRSSISRIENNGDDITLRDVGRLAKALECSPLYLMGWDEEENKPIYKKITNDDDINTLYDRLDAKQKKLVQDIIKGFLPQ